MGVESRCNGYSKFKSSSIPHHVDAKAIGCLWDYAWVRSMIYCRSICMFFMTKRALALIANLGTISPKVWWYLQSVAIVQTIYRCQYKKNPSTQKIIVAIYNNITMCQHYLYLLKNPKMFSRLLLGLSTTTFHILGTCYMCI